MILQRGAVVRLFNGTIVVLLERSSKLGWNCLAIATPKKSNCYYRQDIFVFDEDLKNGITLDKEPRHAGTK